MQGKLISIIFIILIIWLSWMAPTLLKKFVNVYQSPNYQELQLRELERINDKLQEIDYTIERILDKIPAK